jgi:hypothetical protein
MRRRSVSHVVVCVGEEVLRPRDVIVLVKPIDAIGRHEIIPWKFVAKLKLGFVPLPSSHIQLFVVHHPVAVTALGA